MTFYYYHTDFLAHDTGSGHPESAARLKAIEKALSTPEFNKLVRITAPVPDDIMQRLALIHTQAHIDRVFSAIPAQGLAYLDPDTVVSPASGRAALRAVSSVCDAVDKICSHQTKTAFCAVRPPGHHAEPDKAMGFCLFNNIAIAAEYARTQYQIEKMAIVDFDVHHGNGTQSAFYHQPQILYASSHEMPHYPGTGLPSEQGVGNIINVPLAPESSGTEFRDLYRKIIIPALIQFKPDFILISAGFDAHYADPLSSINLNESDYQWVTDELKQIADQYGNGKILSVLEGGYNLQALGSSVAAHVKALMLK